MTKVLPGGPEADLWKPALMHRRCLAASKATVRNSEPSGNSALCVFAFLAEALHLQAAGTESLDCSLPQAPLLSPLYGPSVRSLREGGVRSVEHED